MAFSLIELSCTDGIATLTFNRPKALNALNSALLAEFAQALEEIRNDEATRVLVLTGAGDRAFVAGADITELASLSPLAARSFAQIGQEAISTLQHLPIPVLAAVNGYALGGGCEMALACDCLYASEKAVFGLPEITLGLIPGFGGTQRLPRRIGAAKAKELMFTGGHLSAAEALEIGLVNKVFAPEALLDEVYAIAGKIAVKGRASLAAAKQAVNEGLNTDLATGLRIEQNAFALCFATPDAQEGTAAFLEKRKPVFTGALNQ
ncbi:MAG: enoyl-CoA hydratase/isomerase family protein [Desulfobulbus sp.]